MLVRVFILADTVAATRQLKKLIAPAHVAVSAATAKGSSWKTIGDESGDLMIVEKEALPAPLPDSVRTLAQLPERPDLVVFVREDDPVERANLLAMGCAAVLSWEVPAEVLSQTLLALVERRRERGHWRDPQIADESVRAFREFATASPTMQKVVDTARRVAAADTTLLIVGETGVGKERMARSIHGDSRRFAGPFVALNCAAIPESLLESELFGHERGAFTDAVRTRRGLFELAHRGTLFLDEVADLTPSSQAKLLRAIQERRIHPVGGERELEVDVRFIAATNRDLSATAEQERFRRDLFYRLSVVTLRVPALRERREDVSVLADGFREHFARRLGRPVRDIEPAAMELLVAYDWPGNVRELMNVVEHAVLLCTTESVTCQDLPILCSDGWQSDRPALVGRSLNWRASRWREVRAEALAVAERDYLQELLRHTRGRIAEAAEVAGMSRRAICDKMKRYGLDKRVFKTQREAGEGRQAPQRTSHGGTAH